MPYLFICTHTHIYPTYKVSCFCYGRLVEPDTENNNEQLGMTNSVWGTPPHQLSLGITVSVFVSVFVCMQPHTLCLLSNMYPVQASQYQYQFNIHTECIRRSTVSTFCAFIIYIMGIWTAALWIYSAGIILRTLTLHWLTMFSLCGR